MIGKGKSISYSGNAIDYAKNKPEAIELNRNMVVGETGKEISNEFRIFQNLNTRCKRNSFSFVISPTIEDGRQMTKKDFVSITKEFLEELELDENQYISYLHSDKDHIHIHIIVNRINTKGKAKKDNYIGKKCQRVAEKIALKRNLTTARKIQLNNEKQLKDIIEKSHNKIIQQKPKDINQYVELMKEHNIITNMKHANNGKLVGISFQVGKKTIKGSAVNKFMSAMNLQKTINKLQENINVKMDNNILTLI